MPRNAATEQTEAGEPPLQAVLLLHLQGVSTVEEALVHVYKAFEGGFKRRG